LFLTVKIMIAKIDKDGVLAITPETKEEDRNLAEWYKNYGKEIARKVILFERVKE
jgi:hypothetical protein